MKKQSKESESSKLPHYRQPERQLAPGAMLDVLKLINEQPTQHGTQFISCIKVPDTYGGDFWDYQLVSITVKDGKIIYAAFVGDQSPHINDTINEATQWVDKYFYGLD